LAKERRPLRAHQNERSRDPSAGQACESQPVHAWLFTTGCRPIGNDKFTQELSSFGSMAKLDEQKALIYLREHFPDSIVRGLPLRAILLPRVTGLPNTKLVKAGGMDAFRAIAPTTLLHLTRATDEAARKISTLCRSLPVYWLEAGTDLPQIPQVITEFLKSGAR
jgi:hypothetical protein